jgi:hypothetical protein
MPTRLAEAKALAETLELVDRQVFFGDWVAYGDWPNVLLESDVALTLHSESIEARLAFRSRVLETIWAGLPIVATEGDATSDLIAHYDLGIQVGADQVGQVAAALVALVDEDPQQRATGFTRARADLNWERAAEPLAAFFRAPHRAPDRTQWLTDPRQPARDIEQLQRDVAQWRDRVTRYEQGRFMRAMHWFALQKRKWQGKKR